MSSPAPKRSEREVGDETAKAFEKEYAESHPDGPYPVVELKPKGEAAPSGGGSDVRPRA